MADPHPGWLPAVRSKLLDSRSPLPYHSLVLCPPSLVKLSKQTTIQGSPALLFSLIFICHSIHESFLFSKHLFFLNVSFTALILTY